MNKIIDINDVLTYPEELINLFNNDNDTILDEIFMNYSFKCSHVTCTYDINNYYKSGIMRSFKIFKNGDWEINQELKNIILKPISNLSNYVEYADKYDKILLKEYEENKNLDNNWYGKYSCVCYSLDDISKINSDNPCYELLIKCHGGEIFRDLGLSDVDAEKIASNYKAYVISFKLSYEEIKKGILMEDLIKHMKLMYKIGKSDYEFEGSINKDISPNDFIEIIEVN